jgi:hypothetical protein
MHALDLQNNFSRFYERHFSNLVWVWSLSSSDFGVLSSEDLQGFVQAFDDMLETGGILSGRAVTILRS